MKRQQVISRFFTPKAAAAQPPAPASTSAASPDPAVPRQSYSSAGLPPLASRVPVSSSPQKSVNGSSRDLSADFSFGSGKPTSRKRLQDEVDGDAENSQQEITLASGWCSLTPLWCGEFWLNVRPSSIVGFKELNLENRSRFFTLL